MYEEMTSTETATATCDESTGTELNEELEFVFKVVVVGDYGVGKTSLVKRLLSVPYTQRGDDAAVTLAEESPAASDPCRSVTPTVGTDFFSRVVRNVRGGQHVRLQFWDTAGLERYAAVHATTHRNASAVMAVFDVSDRRSLDSLLSTHLSTAARHNPDLDQRSVIVVGNKTDLLLTSKEKELSSHKPEFVTQRDVQLGLLDALPDIVYHEASAVTNIGVSGLLHSLCQALLKVHGGEEIEELQPATGEAGKQLQYSVLPKGHSTTSAVDTTAAASFAGTEVSPTKAGHSTSEGNDSNAAHNKDAKDPHVTEKHADPYDMPPSKSLKACEVAVNPSVRECAAALEENSLEDKNRYDSHTSSIYGEEPASPPLVSHTLLRGPRQLGPLSAQREGNNSNLLLHSNKDEDECRRTTEYSSADSGDFQREIEDRFKRAEDTARRTAAESRNSQQQKSKKASKVNLSRCYGGDRRAGSGGGGGGDGSAGRKSKGCNC
ncbi:hypothetical protein TcYC6_0106950 [Trypanosoma cruzi]|nr:hypothetical protein TcYC6_0106950 [Trypanosoma cruzi]